ncbi:MAG: rhodanese-like domain-containing protein [Gammaproteobacteria bacterium]|nr:rhodanese-like domain-containing protein [Gammaproteobacteria bacterium]
MPKSLADFVRDAKSRIRELDCSELHRMIQSNSDLLVVDVREPVEFSEGHIADALNIPRGILESAADPSFDKRNERLCRAHNSPVAVYCATGGRSAMAADVLQQMGFEDAVSLQGGITAWIKQGYATEKT